MILSKVEIAVVVLAVGAHGAGIAVARSLPKLSYAGTHFDPLGFMEVDTAELPKAVLPDQPELVVKQPDKQEPTEEAPREDSPASATTETRVATNRASRGSTSDNATGDPTEEPGENGTGPGEGPVADSEDGGWSAPGSNDPPGLPGAPGIGGIAARIAIDNSTAPAAPTTTPKAKKVDRYAATRVLKDELRKQDKALGLDLPAAGTIASLIKSAVQGSDAPGDSKASFVVTLGPGGKVVSVTVASMAGGSSGTWEAIAKMVQAQLKTMKLNLPEDYAKGAIVQVNAVSAMKMPSGANPGDGIKLSLTQNFDVADIGASPVKVVKVSFSSKPVN